MSRQALAAVKRPVEHIGAHCSGLHEPVSSRIESAVQAYPFARDSLQQGILQGILPILAVSDDLGTKQRRKFSNLQ